MSDDPVLGTQKGTRPRTRKLGTRRVWLASLISVLTGGVLLRRVVDRKGASSTVRVEVNTRCVGCTACAVVCPTAAIQIVPGGIHVVQDDCISCGYCQAGCTVEGIVVVSGNARG